MDDKALLEHYLKKGSAQAQRWNLSPANLFIEQSLRAYLEEKVVPGPEFRVCNVGIGAGEWDDYLCHWLDGRGSLLSLDKDSEICETLEYRQERERHPNPAIVLSKDILGDDLPWETHDLLTLVGSTLHETGDYEKSLAACFQLLKEGGELLYMDLLSRHTPKMFQEFCRARGHAVEDLKMFGGKRSPEFFIFLARR